MLNFIKNFSSFLCFVIVLCSFQSANAACNNHVKNPAANNGTTHWQSHGSTTIATLAGGNKCFQVLQSDAHFHQDMAIPSGSTTAYIGGWTRNSQPSAPTGHAYLYAYIMDGSDKILEYVQIGVQNTGMTWKPSGKKVTLTKNARKVRLFLKKSAKNGVSDTGNMAYFDNLVVSFNCAFKSPKPGATCPNRLTNPKADRGTNGWTVQGSRAVIATLAGGNKSFKVMDNDSHFSQDVTIPSGSSTAYIAGYTRNSQASATTGHAYLYAYVLDGSGSILEYVQPGVQNTGMAWKLNEKTVSLPAGAKSIRLFLKRSNIGGQTDTNNNAHFDNLVLSFDCEAATVAPKPY